MPKIRGNKRLSKVLEAVYAKAKGEHGKERASKIAWGAAKKQGWKKIGKKWVKKG